METKEKALKYKDLLLQSQEEKEQGEVQFQVEEAEQQLASDTLATRQSLAKAKRELNAYLSAYPFSASEIISKEVAVEELEDGLKRLENLRKQLF